MKRRNGFTLVELVVVILILGVLAAIAAPKILSTSGTAGDNSMRTTLQIIRNAIDMYAAANNGTLPGADGTQATFVANVAPYIRGSFPKCPVGPTANQNNSIMFTASSPPTGLLADNTGWKYNKTTGEFICNNPSVCKIDGVTTYDQF
jgi:general secretion pathway protein G